MSVGQRAGGGIMSRWSPAIELSEHEGNWVVCADLPRIRKDDVRVEGTEEALVIVGERTHDNEHSRRAYRRTERSCGSFQRVIPLPPGVKPDVAKACCKDGVTRGANTGRRAEVALPADSDRQRRQRLSRLNVRMWRRQAREWQARRRASQAAERQTDAFFAQLESV